MNTNIGKFALLLSYGTIWNTKGGGIVFQPHIYN